MQKQYRTYAEFWPFYLSQHAQKRTRDLHLFGTSLGLAVLAWSLFTGFYWGILLALVCGYGFAWLAHMAIEKNRPATFTYPLWSLMGDFHMLWLAAQGRLDAEIKRLSTN